MPCSFRGGLYQLFRVPEAAYIPGFVLIRRAEGLSARVLLMLRLPLTVFCMVPFTSFAAPHAGEAKRLAQHIPGPLRTTIFKGRTHAEERRSKNTAQTSLVSEEDEQDITLLVEDENTLEQALQVDIEASVEMPTGKMQGFPPPPTTQEEVRRSPFRKACEHSQKVELNGLLAVGCFQVVDEKDVPKGRKDVGSQWEHAYRSDGYGNCSKTKSRVVAKGLPQVQIVDYHKTTSPTPASAPVKMKAAIANEKDLPVFHLDVSQAFVEAPLEKEILMRLYSSINYVEGNTPLMPVF